MRGVPMERAWIISIGTELTLGQTVDTNSAWLSRRLAAVGVRTARHLTVSDERAPIRDALAEAARAADLVLVTGGLGPTDDDLTREALSDAMGQPLELHAPSLAQIRAFFTARGRTMPERNASQAMIPRGAVALANPVGTAPGIRATLAGTPVFVMPGVPFEMERMFDDHVAGEIAVAARGRAISSRTIYTYGLGESLVGERIADLMRRGRNPEVGTTAQHGVIGVRINAQGADRTEAEALAAADEAEVRRRLGSIVFGRDGDTLASATAALLVARARTVATAESCTGGLVGAMLTEVPGSSAYFLGGAVTYSNAAKSALLRVPPESIAEHGAVSEPVACAMADGARQVFGTDYAVAVTGIAGPAGGSPGKPVGLVYVALSASGGTRSRPMLLGAELPRWVIRHRAACAAINVLREALLSE